MDTPEIPQNEAEGLRRLTLEDAALREARERRQLLRQSIADERRLIVDIDRRREWQQRFDAAVALLRQNQQEAQNASRAWAGESAERDKLALHDRLTGLRPLYDRAATLQDVLTRTREAFIKGEQELSQVKAQREQARNAADVARQRRFDTHEALRRRQADFTSGYRIEGSLAALERQLKQADSVLQQTQLNLGSKERALKEMRLQEADALKQLEEAHTQVKGLSAHSVMLGFYDLVKDKLTAMGRERLINEKLHAQQAEAGRQREMMRLSIRQHESEKATLQREYDKHRSQLAILGQSADTILDVVRAPIIRDADETQRQLEKFFDLRLRVRRLEEQVQLADLQLQAKREQLEKLNTEAAVADSHRLSLEQLMRESDQAMGVLYADLDKIITLSGWFTEWQHNPDALRSRISKLYHEWQNARNRHAEQTRSAALIREALKAAEQSVAEARQEEIRQRNQRDAVRRELESQKEKLHALFSEKAPAAVEQALTQDCQQADKQMEEANECLKEAQEAYRSCQSRQDTLRSEQEKCQELLRQANLDIDLWIQNHNAEGLAVLQRSVVDDIYKSPCDWVRLRSRLDESTLRKAVAATRQEDTDRVLAGLQCSPAATLGGKDESPAQWLQRKQEAEQRLDRFETELREVEGRLYAHEQAHRKIEMLMR